MGIKKIITGATCCCGEGETEFDFFDCGCIPPSLLGCNGLCANKPNTFIANFGAGGWTDCGNCNGVAGAYVLSPNHVACSIASDCNYLYTEALWCTAPNVNLRIELSFEPDICVFGGAPTQWRYLLEVFAAGVCTAQYRGPFYNMPGGGLYIGCNQTPETLTKFFSFEISVCCGPALPTNVTLTAT